MPYLIIDKIKIGVSACNFGARVRYNRKGADRVGLLEREKDAFLWTPVCPEVFAGLGVPREPMKLVDGNGDAFWTGRARVKNKKGLNVSAVVRDGAQAALACLKRAGVEAYIFMDGSPSCGVYRTTLKNARLGKPPGVFGSLLLKEKWFLIPALDLESPLKWWDWRRRLHAFVYLKRAALKTKNEFYALWHNYKFLVQELDRPAADRIGRALAKLSKRPAAADFDRLKDDILLVLRQPTTLGRVKNAAEKQMSYFCKHFGICYPEKLAAERDKAGFVKRLYDLEKRAVAENIDLSLAPVLYRQTR